MPTNPSIDLLSNRQPSIYYVEIGVAIIPCSGSPQGVIAANRGSLALDIASGNAYLKTTNTVSTGWVIIGSGGAGNPSPPNFSVQFNQGGVFMGDAEFTYDPVSNTLSLVNLVITGTLTVNEINATTIKLPGFTPGSVLFAGAASEIDEDAVNFFYNDGTKQLSVIGIVQSNASFVSGIPNSVSGDIVLFASGSGSQTTIRSADIPIGNRIIKLPENDANELDYLEVDSNTAGTIQTKWVRNSPVTLVDAATIAIDASLSKRFEASSATSRTLGIPTNPKNGWQFSFRWRNTDASAHTLTLTTGSAGAFRYNDTVTVLPATDANSQLVFTAVYDSTDDRWDVLGFVNNIA